MAKALSHNAEHTTHPWKIIAAVCLLTFVAFGWSLTQNFAPIDDAFLIVRNLAIRGITPATLRLAFTTYDPELYVPLTIISFQINYLIAGLHPWIYHLTNILLHAGNAVLLMALLTKITGHRFASIAAGLLFAVHPLHTEAVVWAAGRKDLLSTFFALCSAVLYLRNHDQPKPNRAYALSIFTFGCALLGKVTPATLPAVFVLHEVLLRKRRDWRNIIPEQLPYLLISAILVTVAMGGKEQVLNQVHAGETILLTIKSIIFYMGKILVPIGLSVFYPYAGIVRISDPQIWIPMIILGLLMIMLIRYGRRSPVTIFGLLTYFILLSPTFLHFRRAGDLYFAVDRYAYLPSIGIFMILAMGIAWMHDRYRQSTIRCLIMLILLISTGLSIRQTTFWNSQTSLFGQALKLYPQATRARTNLVRKLRKDRKPQEAYNLLQEGIRTADAMELHEQLGYLYAETGHIADAHQEFLTARDMKPGDPNPLFDIASLAEQTGQSEVAIEGYKAVITLEPSFVIARVHLAKLLRITAKDMRGAEEQIQEAIRWNPNSAEAHAEFSSLLRAQERMKEADRELAIARSIDENSIPMEITASEQ